MGAGVGSFVLLLHPEIRATVTRSKERDEWIFIKP